MEYGYCRISTPKQNIDRQIRNIEEIAPDAKIIKETYTGTTTDRPEWIKLQKKLNAGDTIYFDSVSRMSRDADEGFRQYQELYDRNINLVFLKEAYLNTDTFRQSMQNQIASIPASGDASADRFFQSIIDAVNQYALDIARRQIMTAFEQSEKEVTDLRQRTREGIETARINGKQIGREQGDGYETKKAKKCKEIILKHNRAFGGSLTDADTITLCGCSRNSYFKYKAELKKEGAVNA